MSRQHATACNLETESRPRATPTRLSTPAELAARLPVEPLLAARIAHQRDVVRDVLAGRDPRLLVITGPCSLHDRASALDYGARLAELAEECADEAVLVMRAYVEKPRTTVGWKGLLHDPHLDGGNDIDAGLAASRGLLIELAELGLPIATELLTPIVADYLSDVLSWAAIGARTTESQTHRERASALELPVGFKNGTDGSIGTAIDAVSAAAHPQCYLGTDRDGRPAAIAAPGNPDAHLVLRGGRHGANHDATSVSRASEALAAVGACERLIVDCSHANSGKVAARQAEVMADLTARRRAGESAIAGVMLESHIAHGKQPLGADLTYGVSITDECLDWETTAAAIRAACGR
ncbi:3-deoxy-7-phosphoheptulonate synthase [Salinisphaera sp.]|uniref:3-deoxy-7-phosphoheptulonate synthase n=1 Tax=Salinisphaera sp. TaxID=1914330 RepID=UPI002D78F025|nr:3-deoxy-7-phosphoheptulonate synthase [Salinisphaera sp.]HET7314489.1 3-deoxy-7-phosphoheptulonate synthase [Salinisphaera sp.]